MCRDSISGFCVARVQQLHMICGGTCSGSIKNRPGPVACLAHSQSSRNVIEMHCIQLLVQRAVDIQEIVEMR